MSNYFTHLGTREGIVSQIEKKTFNWCLSVAVCRKRAGDKSNDETQAHLLSGSSLLALFWVCLASLLPPVDGAGSNSRSCPCRGRRRLPGRSHSLPFRDWDRPKPLVETACQEAKVFPEPHLEPHDFGWFHCCLCTGRGRSRPSWIRPCFWPSRVSSCSCHSCSVPSPAEAAPAAPCPETRAAPIVSEAFPEARWSESVLLSDTCSPTLDDDVGPRGGTTWNILAADVEMLVARAFALLFSVFTEFLCLFQCTSVCFTLPQCFSSFSVCFSVFLCISAIFDSLFFFFFPSRFSAS